MKLIKEDIQEVNKQIDIEKESLTLINQKMFFINKEKG